MKYRASNGITPAVELTEAEAREHYERGPKVFGEFGGRFVVCPLGEMGHLLTCAATTYEPIADEAAQPRRWSWRFWRRLSSAR